MAGWRADADGPRLFSPPNNTRLAINPESSVPFFPVTLISVVVAFVFRVFAVKEHWKQIVPYAPLRDGLHAA